MDVRFLMDENLSPARFSPLDQCSSVKAVVAVGDYDAPDRGTPDPHILRWCEEHSFILVTDNRRTIPRHLADHLASGGHVPGVLILRRKAAWAAVINDLILIAEAGIETDLADHVEYLPLRMR